MRSPLAVFPRASARVLGAVGAVALLSLASSTDAQQRPQGAPARPASTATPATPDSGVARATPATRMTPAQPAAPAVPRPGQCAYAPATPDRLLGVVESVGAEGTDAAGRPSPGQRRVHVRLRNRIEINVTWPKNLVVRDCG